MAKVPRYARTRIASTINARYHPDDAVIDSYFLDGRFPSRRESRAVDMTTVREDRGFFYGIFAHPKDEQKATADMSFAPALEKLNNEVRGSAKNIDEQINDLADVAVDVTGRATLARDGVRQSWFSGILLKEGEIAAVTTTAGCALLYRGDVLYPLTESDFQLEAIDYNGNPIEGINDYAAGVAGTIRYSNIAQVKPNDCVILCNRELLEALGQRELLRLLFEAEDQMEAAQQIMTAAAAKAPTVSLQVLLAFVEDVNLQSKTGRLNLGLFNTGSTPTPQELKRSESGQGQSHNVEDNRNNMKRNDNYGDRNRHDNNQHDTGTWSVAKNTEYDDSAFAPPADYADDQYADYTEHDAYQESDSQFSPDYQTQNYAADEYADDYTEDYSENYDDSYHGDYGANYADGDYADPDYSGQDYGGADYGETYAGYDDYNDGYYDDGYSDDYGDGYDDGYGDEYYDEYYDDYDYEKREKTKRLIILGVIALILLLAIFFLGRKFLSGKDKNKENETTAQTTELQEVVKPSEEKQPPQVQPIPEQQRPEPQENKDVEDLFELTFYSDPNETPRQFLNSIYGKDDQIYYEFLKRYNPTLPEMDSPMPAGSAWKVPASESGPFKILDSWMDIPEIKEEYDAGVQKVREAKEANPPADNNPDNTDFNQDENQTGDQNDDQTGDQNDNNG
ncbi:MAG: hypothetical protein Q4P08_02855 [Eubacteriales bacterium]|nr:hypothetical protein [Eubacteriales bacterium]